MGIEREVISKLGISLANDDGEGAEMVAGWIRHLAEAGTEELKLGVRNHRSNGYTEHSKDGSVRSPECCQEFIVHAVHCSGCNGPNPSYQT